LQASAVGEIEVFIRFNSMIKIIWDYPDDKQRGEAGAGGSLPAASVVKPPISCFPLLFSPQPLPVRDRPLIENGQKSQF
jgi:hypothetical protein